MRTLSKYLTLSVAAILICIGVSSLLISSNTRDLEDKWTNFERKAAQKALLLGQIRGLMGYDGMIHHFKNYVLRQERWRIVEVHKKLIELELAVTAYRNIGVNDQETPALESFERTIVNYHKVAILAEQLADNQRLADEIDQLVIIDDTEAIRALRTLDETLAAIYAQSTNVVSDAIGNIRIISMTIGIGMVIFIGALLYLLTNFMKLRVVTPLESLSGSIKRINPEDPGEERLKVLEKWGSTEITEFANRANEFLEQVSLNIKTRRKTNAKLRDSEEYLRNIVENAVDAIITIDQKGKIVSYNASASTLFYYSEREALGKKHLKFDART